VKRQSDPRDTTTPEAMKKKLQSVRDKGYITPGHVTNLTHVFPVDKADSDIRLVYNCTRSLVNDALWAPMFALPTIEAVLRAMESDTWGADLD